MIFTHPKMFYPANSVEHRVRVCNDPAVSAHVRLLIWTFQIPGVGSLSSAPGTGADGCRTQSSLPAFERHVAAYQTVASEHIAVMTQSPMKMMMTTASTMNWIGLKTVIGLLALKCVPLNSQGLSAFLGLVCIQTHTSTSLPNVSTAPCDFFFECLSLSTGVSIEG